MGDSSKGGRKGINWLAVRTYYISGHSAAECAAKFGVSKRTVEIRRKEESWGSEHRNNLADAKQNLAKLSTSEIAKTMLTHIDYADRLMQIAIDGEQDLASMDPGRSRMEARKLLLEAADKAVRIAREVRGMKSGDSSSAEDDEQQPGSIEIRKTHITKPANDNLRELLG